VASGETTLLTDGKSRNSEGAWSNKGDRMAYLSRRRNNAELDSCVMSPSDKTTDKMIAQNQVVDGRCGTGLPTTANVGTERSLNQRELCLAH